MKKLKELLESGAISQEQYDILAGTEPKAEPQPQTQDEAQPDLDKLIQSKIDKALAQERKEKAEIKKRFEKLQEEKLTAEEKQRYAFEQQQQELDAQRKALQAEKLKMYAVKALKLAEIADNDQTLPLIEKLSANCDNEEAIDEIVQLLKKWHDTAVTVAVEKRFKNGGSVPNKSAANSIERNPYAPETYNLTEIMKLESTNPIVAEQLKAMAGVK